MFLFLICDKKYWVWLANLTEINYRITWWFWDFLMLRHNIFLNNILQWCKLKLLKTRNGLWLSWQKFYNLKFRLNNILRTLTYKQTYLFSNKKNFWQEIWLVTNLNNTILYTECTFYKENNHKSDIIISMQPFTQKK